MKTINIMRLIIKISPQQKTPQPVNSYLIQGLIYNIVRNSKFAAMHNKARYKFFCFSNIFPFIPNRPLQIGKEYNLLISSPNFEFINYLNNKIKLKASLNLGNYTFSVINTQQFTIDLQENSSLVTATPVVISIPKSMFEKYSISSERNYLYWNSQLSLNLFVEAVSKNSLRKFNTYYSQNLSEDLLLFRTFRFKRGALVRYKNAEVAGSIWDLTIAPEKQAQKVLQFILDTGLGEKNSAGFGFLNVR